MKDSLPKRIRHLGIIPDGNGRWALAQGLERAHGHVAGYGVFREVLKHLRRLGLEELTFFALSSENLQRPKNEIDALMMLFLQAVHTECEMLKEHRIEIRVMGDRSHLSSSVQEAIDFLEAQDVSPCAMRLNLAFAYGGQWHIESAFEASRRAQGDLDTFRALLLHPMRSPMDVLIRSGGEMRLSNFALWALAYTELMFLPTLWPEVTLEQIDECCRLFELRQRRFGKVS